VPNARDLDCKHYIFFAFTGPFGGAWVSFPENSTLLGNCGGSTSYLWKKACSFHRYLVDLYCPTNDGVDRIHIS
jgi:hypothetical protein